jgi:hypothetical protein
MQNFFLKFFRLILLKTNHPLTCYIFSNFFRMPSYTEDCCHNCTEKPKCDFSCPYQTPCYLEPHVETVKFVMGLLAANSAFGETGLSVAQILERCRCFYPNSALDKCALIGVLNWGVSRGLFLKCTDERDVDSSDSESDSDSEEPINRKVSRRRSHHRRHRRGLVTVFRINPDAKLVNPLNAKYTDQPWNTGAGITTTSGGGETKYGQLGVSCGLPSDLSALAKGNLVSGEAPGSIDILDDNKKKPYYKIRGLVAGAGIKLTLVGDVIEVSLA